MDTKFRKLISRLSSKEKDKTVNNINNNPADRELKTSSSTESNHYKIVVKKKNNVNIVEEHQQHCDLNENGDCVGAGVSEDSRKHEVLLEDDDDDGKVIVVTETSLAARNSNSLLVVSNFEDESLETHQEDDDGFNLRHAITMLSIDTNNHNHHQQHVHVNNNGNNNDLLTYSTSIPMSPAMSTSSSSSGSAFGGTPSELSLSSSPSEGLDILTNVQFSCPTLVRKKKKIGVAIVNGNVKDTDALVIYEELKPAPPAKQRLYLKKGQEPSSLQLCNEIIGPEMQLNETMSSAEMKKDETDLRTCDDGVVENGNNKKQVEDKLQVRVVEINIEKCNETMMGLVTPSSDDEEEEDAKSQSSTTSSSILSSRSADSSCPNSVSTTGSNHGDISESSSSVDENNNAGNGNDNGSSDKENVGRNEVDPIDNKHKPDRQVGIGKEDEDGSFYVNMQELELARRKLIAAQVVKAKYAENWIDGQVINDSIISNKEQTRQYWEIRLRRDQDAKNKAKGLTNNSSAAVIQKMNREIEELHRRERELKKLSHTKTSDDDEEEDAFSSNGSSVADEFEHSESPRLESGFYSNVGEDDLTTTISSPELVKVEVVVVQKKEQQEVGTEVVNERGTAEGKFEVQDEVVKLNESGKNTTSPPPEETTYTTFHIANYRKETPIEREIRLAHEREQELYRLRRSSSASVESQPQVSPRPAELSSSSPKAGVSVVSAKSFFESKSPGQKNKGKSGKDIQYILATERLKREIQEAKQREDELKGRGKSNGIAIEEVEPSSPEKLSRSPSISEETEEEVKAEEPMQIAIPNGEVLQEKATSPKPVPKQRDELVKTSVVTVVTPSVPEDAPAPKPRVNGSPEIASVTSPTTTTSNYTSFLGRPKFNSIERYLLKSSLQLRIGTNFQVPKPAPEPATPEQPTETTNETEEAELAEPKAPRRRLVSTQHRIAAELKEMREREKELAQIRKYKSTSDLTMTSPTSPMLLLSPGISNCQHEDEEDVFTESNAEDGSNNEFQGPPGPMMARSFLKRDAFANHDTTTSFDAFTNPDTTNSFSTMTNGNSKTRKKSALVSQWEERIHSNINSNESKA